MKAGLKLASDKQTLCAESLDPYKQDPQREDTYRYYGEQADFKHSDPIKKAQLPSFFFLIGVRLFYNVVLVSTVQQSGVPCTIQQVLISYLFYTY